MSKKKNSKSKSTDIDFDLSELAGEAGLTLLRDSEYAMIFDRIPTFLPNLDRILGGGFPFGRMVEIAGKPGAGKSHIAYHVARVGVSLGCLVVLIDVEGTADRERLQHLGIDTSKVFVKQPDPDAGIKLTVEEVGKTIEETIAVFSKRFPDRPIIYIWDSVGQTPSDVEMGKEFGEQNVGARAKAITQFVTKVAPLVSETKSLLIGINQVRDDIGGNPMFKTYSVPGGNAWEHYASLRIEVKRKKAIEAPGAGKVKIGHTMGIHLRKSKVSRPFQEEDIVLISDNGIDYEENLCRLAMDSKILDGVGQSYEYVDANGEIHKKRRADFVEWLRTEEASEVRRELLGKLVFENFPEGYTALGNRSVDILGWEDAVDLPKLYEELGATSILDKTE